MLKRKTLRKCFLVGMMLFAVLSVAHSVFAQPKTTPAATAPVAAAPATAASMSLWDLAQAGGFVMIILSLMSVAGLALIIYNLRMLNADKLVPKPFANRLIELLEKSDERGVRELCSSLTPNIFSRIVTAGLAKKRRGPTFVRESMESVARQEIGAMWHQISYLSDLGSIGPLVGLLGTVIGMIQAFSSIAFQAASVKPVLLVGGVSKAMVCTAGGLVVAIPALLAYAYFKGIVIRLSRDVETTTAEMIKIIEDRHENFLGDTYVKI